MSAHGIGDVYGLIAKAQALLAKHGYTGVADRLAVANEEIAELRDAAESVDRLYPMHWDTTGGGALIMPERVPEFEARFQRLHEALAAITVQGDSHG